MSTRNRGEPPLKKRALTPTPPPPRAAPAKTAKAPDPVEIREEGLPVRLSEGRPLPTLPEPQDINVSAKAFQTISESGVLAASIERSKQRWLTDGVFERYWTRPVKKATPNPSNPPKETMQKLGVCSMIIEPHVFEVTLYTVRDLPTAPLSHSVNPPPPSHYNPFPQNPSYSPPVYSGPFTGVTDSPSQHPFREGFNRPGPYVPPPPTYHGPSQVVTQTGSSGPPQLRRTSTSNIGSPAEAPQSDPVIQILATRAASDHALKNLMKVVASGQASPEQLKEFQDHIDEINTSLKSRRNSHSQKGGAEPPKAPTPDDPLPSVEVHSSPPAPSPARPVPLPAHNINQATQPPPVPIKAEPLPQIYPHAPPPLPLQPQHPPKPKPLFTKPDIHSIVFDFSSTGDRFLLPRFSIAEYLPGNTQVVISFLIVRRGSLAASASNYNKNKTYYQPITVRLSCPNPRILEPVAKVLAPQDEVRRYMDGVFDKLLPAENVFLATRLPRSKDGEEGKNEEMVETRREDVVQATYEAPSSLVPMAV